MPEIPTIRAAKRKPAIAKLQRAEIAIRKAEQEIHSITAEELEEIGFSGLDRAVGTGPNPRSARNMIYQVYAHASTLRIVREHLRTEMGQ